MTVNERGGQTDTPTELAGEATVDSPPSERDSDDAENGLEAGADAEISLPGRTFIIDAADESDRSAA